VSTPFCSLPPPGDQCEGQQLTTLGRCPGSFIARYTAPEVLAGETLYYYTQLVSVISFVENIDGSHLNIEPQACLASLPLPNLRPVCSHPPFPRTMPVCTTEAATAVSFLHISPVPITCSPRYALPGAKKTLNGGWLTMRRAL
jgi:hypothetical protein